MPVFCALFLLATMGSAIPALPAGDGVSDGASTREPPHDKDVIDQVLAKYIAVGGRSIARGATMVAHFAGRLPKLEKSATLDARRHVDKQGVVKYEMTERQGDLTVQKELIARFMNGEEDSSSKNNTKVAITPDNYKFKYKGRRERDGRSSFVFEISPKKKREGLFRGEIWLDAETALTVREAGRFVKSPSVFLKKVEFTREYSIQEGVAVPKLMQTSIETRFWGTAELDIQYGGLTWEDPRFYSNSN